MEEGLVRLFTYLGVNAFRSFGWVGIICVVLAFFAIGMIRVSAARVWRDRKGIWVAVSTNPFFRAIRRRRIVSRMVRGKAIEFTLERNRILRNLDRPRLHLMDGVRRNRTFSKAIDCRSSKISEILGYLESVGHPLADCTKEILSNAPKRKIPPLSTESTLQQLEQHNRSRANSEAFTSVFGRRGQRVLDEIDKLYSGREPDRVAIGETVLNRLSAISEDRLVENGLSRSRLKQETYLRFKKKNQLLIKFFGAETQTLPLPITNYAPRLIDVLFKAKTNILALILERWIDPHSFGRNRQSEAEY